MAENAPTNSEDQITSPNESQVPEVAQPETIASGAEPAASETKTSDKPLEDQSLEDLEQQLGFTGEQTTEEKPAAAPQPEAPKPESQAQEPKPDDPQEHINNQDKQSRSINRFQKLANEKKELAEKVARLEAEKQAQLATQVGIKPPPWIGEKQSKPEVADLPKLEPGQEIDPQQYQQHILQTAQKLVDARLTQRDLVQAEQLSNQEKVLELDRSMDYIRRTYPELDPQSSAYDEGVDEMVGEIVDGLGKVNPKLIREKVDTLMRLRSKSIQAGSSQAAATIAQQAGESAVAPGASISVQAKKPEDMGLGELESKLGFV